MMGVKALFADRPSVRATTEQQVGSPTRPVDVVPTLQPAFALVSGLAGHDPNGLVGLA
jgi:hypothetical protein